MEDLYQRIEKLCKERFITINKMCSVAGVPRSCIYELKSGRNKGVSRKNAEKIASFFGMTVDELYSGKQKEKPPTMDGRVFELITICNQLTNENLLKAADYIRYLLSTQG